MMDHIKQFWKRYVAGAVIIPAVFAAGLEVDNTPNGESLEVSATCNTDQPVVIGEKLQFKFNCTTSDNRSFTDAVYYIEAPQPEKLVREEVERMNSWINIVVDQSNNEIPDEP